LKTNGSISRFEFGHNWQYFLDGLNDARIIEAEQSLVEMLGDGSVAGKTFLDIGSGSGLFSLAALRLGASQVYSFDYDRDSMECALSLKNHYFPDSVNWKIEQGDILDNSYLNALRQWDVVYAWGVLHHTGDLWQALENAASLVADSGLLFIAIYNDQGLMSHVWLKVKQLYNIGPDFTKTMMNFLFFMYFSVGMFIADVLRRKNPLIRYTGKQRRGMKVYRDVVDWIGGYPFEVASPNAIFRFFRDRGFTLKEMKTCGGRHGCNEFVFQR